MVVLVNEDEITRRWSSFFGRKAIAEKIKQLCVDSCKKRRLSLDYPEIFSSDSDLAESILLDPKNTISIGEGLLAKTIRSPKHPQICITGLPQQTIVTIDRIAERKDGRFLSVKGIVVKGPVHFGTMYDSDDKQSSDCGDAEIIGDLCDNDQRLTVRLRDIDTDIFGRVLIFNGFFGNSGVFEVNSVELPDNFYGTSFSEEEKEKILHCSRDPDFFNDLVSSIAPDVHDMEDVKSILALQLFGGVSRNNDGFMLGNIHLLLLAEPGTEVSSLLRSMSRLSPKGIFLPDNRQHADIRLNGKGIFDHDGGTSAIEVGAVTIANEGLVCCDNLARYKDEEGALHIIVHDAIDTFRCGPSMIRLPSNTSLLCSMIPDTNMITDGLKNREQTDLHPHILGQFDMVIPIRNTPKKAVPVNDIQPSTVYDEEFIRKYVAYARLNCRPAFCEQITDLAMKEYQSLRKSHDCTNGRLAELMIALAEASARSRLSDTVEEIDVLRGSALVGNCLNRLDSLYHRS